MSDTYQLTASELSNNSVTLSWDNFIEQPANIEKLAIGWWTVAAIRTDGTISVWGSNGSNVLAHPLINNAQEIVVLSDVSTYYYNSVVVLCSDGTVQGWGHNGSGQLTGLDLLPPVVAISGGRSSMTFLTSNGEVIEKGSRYTVGHVMVEPLYDLINASGVIKISNGGTHTLALLSSGNVIAWGYNDYGQCNVPGGIAGRVVAISAGDSHSLALLNDGSVVAWGNTADNRCEVPAGMIASSISAGYNWSVAVTVDGNVVKWGYSFGSSYEVPTGLNEVQQVVAGRSAFLALKNNREVVGWGLANNRELDVPPFYDVYRNGSLHRTVPLDQTSYVYNDLSANTSYTFQVKGCNNAIRVIGETDIITVNTLLNSPYGLSVSNCRYDSYTLAWSASSSNVVGYEIFRDGVSVAVVPETDRSYVFSESVADSYTHQIRALGSGDLVSPLSAAFVLNRHSVPTNLRIQSISESSIVLAWDSVASVEELGNFGDYEIYKNGDFLLNVSAVSSETANISLMPGEIASFTIRAAGSYSYPLTSRLLSSHLSSAISTEHPLGKLVAPTGVVAMDIESNRFKLAWTLVTNATYYTIRFADSVGGPFIDYSFHSNVPVAVNTAQILLTNLVLNVPRYYVVIAHAPDYISSNMSAAIAVTGLEKLVAPSNVIVEPNTTSVRLYWNVADLPQDAITTAYLAGTSTVVGMSETGISSVVVSGLQPSTTYNFTLKTSASGYLDSDASAYVVARTRLTAPIGLRTTAIKADSVSLEWDEVVGAAGYDVYWKEAPFDWSWYSIRTSTPVNQALVPGLSANTSYQFVVVAKTGISGEALSSPMDECIANALEATTKLETPRNLFQGYTTNSNFQLFFYQNVANVYNYNRVVGATSYEVYKSESRESYGELYATFNRDESEAGSFLISKADEEALSEDAFYFVRAKNASNESDFSSPLFVIIPPRLTFNPIIQPAYFGSQYTPFGSIMYENVDSIVSFTWDSRSRNYYDGIHDNYEYTWTANDGATSGGSITSGGGNGIEKCLTNVIYSKPNTVVTLSVRAEWSGPNPFLDPSVPLKHCKLVSEWFTFTYRMPLSAPIPRLNDTNDPHVFPNLMVGTSDATTLSFEFDAIGGATAYEVIIYELLLNGTVRRADTLTHYGFNIYSQSAGELLIDNDSTPPFKWARFKTNHGTVTGLHPNSAYEVWVRAINEINNNNSAYRYCGYVYTAPEAPVVIKKATGSTFVTLSWEDDVPSSTPYTEWLQSLGVAPRYDVVVNYGEPDELVVADYKDKVVTIVDLSPETSYTFSVIAYAMTSSLLFGAAQEMNGFWTSGVSLMSGTTAPYAPLLSDPTNIKATSFDISWSLGADVVSHEVYVNDIKYEDCDDPYITITDRRPNNVYRVQIKSIDSAGSVSELSGTKEVLTLLATPINLRVIAQDPLNVTIEWDGVRGATEYLIYKEDGENVVSFANSFIPKKQLALPGGLHALKIQAISANNESELSDWFIVNMDDLLDTPVLSVESVGALSCRLAWAPVAGAVRYEIDIWGMLTGPYFIALATEHDVVGCTLVPGLEPGKNYAFAVRAIGDGTYSERSNWVEVDTLTAMVTPADLSYDTLKANSVRLFWQPVVDAVSYVVVRDNDVEETVLVSELADANAPEKLITGLSPHVYYNFTVQAIGADNQSSRSSALRVRTLLETPSNFVASKISSSSFELSWDSVDFATSYTVDENENTIGGINELKMRKPLLIGNSPDKTHLLPETTYHMRVKAHYSSSPSDTNHSEYALLDVTTLVRLDKPNQPRLVIGSHHATGFAVEWDSVAGALEYEVYLNNILQGKIVDLNKIFSGLEPKTDYEVRVQAWAGDNYSELSDPLLMTTIANVDVVMGLNATDIKGTEFVLTWTVSNNAVAYDVFCDGDVIAEDIEATTFKVENRIPATEYAMAVQAKGADNNVAEMSETLRVITLNYLATPVLSASSISGTSLILDWDNVPDATSYNLYRNDLLMSEPDTNSYIVTGLSSGTVYNFTAQALGDKNYSRMSEVLVIKTYTRPSLTHCYLEIARDVEFQEIVFSLKAADGIISLSSFGVFLEEGAYYWRVNYDDGQVTESRAFEVVAEDGEFIVSVTSSDQTVESIVKENTDLTWDGKVLRGNTEHQWTVTADGMVSNDSFTFTTGAQSYIEPPVNTNFNYEPTAKTVTLTWDAVDEAEGYRVLYKVDNWDGGYVGTGLTHDGELANSPIEVDATTTSVVLGNLVANKIYWFFVQALGVDTESEIVRVSGNVSPVAEGALGAGFGAPQQVRCVFNQATKEIQLTWRFDVPEVPELPNEPEEPEQPDSGTLDWEWAVMAGGLYSDFVRDIAVDSSGNCYITGLCAHTATFGDSPEFTSPGIFVAKIDASGEWQWVARAGAGYGHGIVVDSSGNCYITGVSFNADTFDGINTMGAVGEKGAFVAKIDVLGEWQWVIQASGGVGCDIVVDSSGNCYITGSFSSSIVLGDINLTRLSERDIDGYDTTNIFVAKLDASGEWLWAVGTDRIGFNASRRIALDPFGNCYVIGYFSETIAFGSIDLTSLSGQGVFVAKLNSLGEWQWASEVGSSDASWSYYSIGGFYPFFDIAVDVSGDCYATGTFQGMEEILVVKLNSLGELQWTANTVGGARANCIFVDAIGNCYVAGNLESGTVEFGSISLTISDNNVFVAKLSALGQWQWAVNVENVGSFPTIFGLSVDLFGNCYITGQLFDPSTMTFGSTVLTSSGRSYDIFVAKLGTR